MLLDREVAPDSRGAVAEMLHVAPRRPTVRALLACLNDPSATVRFWCVYTLGSLMQFNDDVARIVKPALQQIISDTEVAEGWWSVGQEARAVLTSTKDEAFEQELRLILEDPAASQEDRRWAECYISDESIVESGS